MSDIIVFDKQKAFLRKFLIFIVFSAIILLSFASCGKTETGESVETGAETLTEHVTKTELPRRPKHMFPMRTFL